MATLGDGPVAVLAVARRAPADAPAAVTVRVTSVAPGEPIEFAVRAFGAGLRPGPALDRATTPYEFIVRGREAHALVRQVGGRGTMRVELRTGGGQGGSAVGPVSLVIAEGGRVAATGFAR